MFNFLLEGAGNGADLGSQWWELLALQELNLLILKALKRFFSCVFPPLTIIYNNRFYS